MIAENLNELDENIMQARELVDKFNSVITELKAAGRTDEQAAHEALRMISKLLTMSDYKILALVKELQLSNTQYLQRRKQENWDPTGI